MSGTPELPRLPWLTAPLRRALSTQRGHALLVHGPRGVGQFELSLLLAAARLCEDEEAAVETRPCGHCPSCRLVRARSHPDLMVLIPQALREAVGWSAGSAEAEEGGEPAKNGKKPSKEIRVEAVRAAIALATTTSSRGRGKALVIHPAERMNDIAANAFLKTLEEPAGKTIFVLSTASPDALLPTIRSRCQAIALPVPPAGEAVAWLEAQGVKDATTLLMACGGQPQEVLAWADFGVDAAAWRSLPGRIARGEASALYGLPLAFVIESLQKLCHDAAAQACGGAPRYFPAESVSADGDLVALLAWSRALSRLAAESDHPWIADLGIETLVEQGRQALKTARSERRSARTASLNSSR